MTPTKPLAHIEHVVVLMFENRSFDNVLGCIHPHGPDFDGVPPGWSNPVDPYDPTSQQIAAFMGPNTYDTAIMPFPDPNEDYKDMTEQICGGTMKGFVANYIRALGKKGADPNKARDIMQYYGPAKSSNMRISQRLGEFYTVSDRYFGSGPVQTWPNRLFAHCATPGSTMKDGKPYSYLNNTEYPNYPTNNPLGGLNYKTIFELLDEKPPKKGREPWGVYYDDLVPLSAMLSYVRRRWISLVNPIRVHPLQSNLISHRTFFEDVANNRLPSYSFLEPRYQKMSVTGSSIPPNSNHPGGSTLKEGNPPIDVSYGENLLSKVYKALRDNTELFRKTLLIVTYDEHGGLFDHVGPPPAISPFLHPETFANFAYTNYGPRVPAIFINPYVKPIKTLRPPEGKYFDHTSIISTLCAQFDLNGPLTPRDAAAPTFEGLIDPAIEPREITDLPEIQPFVAESRYVMAEPSKTEAAAFATPGRTGEPDESLAQAITTIYGSIREPNTLRGQFEYTNPVTELDPM